MSVGGVYGGRRGVTTKIVEPKPNYIEIIVSEGLINITNYIEEYIKCFLPEGEYEVVLISPLEIKGNTTIISGKEPCKLEVSLKYFPVNERYTGVYEKLGEEESVNFKVEISGNAGISDYGYTNIYKIKKVE